MHYEDPREGLTAPCAVDQARALIGRLQTERHIWRNWPHVSARLSRLIVKATRRLRRREEAAAWEANPARGFDGPDMEF